MREGLIGQKASGRKNGKALVAVSGPRAAPKERSEFCSQKLCLDRNEGCCATSQCELKSEIYQTFACVPFLILDPLASWTINKETVDCGRPTLPFFSSAFGFRSGLEREGPAADLPQQLGFGRVFWEWRPELRRSALPFANNRKSCNGSSVALDFSSSISNGET